MIVRVTCFSVLVWLATQQYAWGDKKPYTIADLKVLVAKKSFKEAYLHLDDVTPSDRGADWLDVAATASTGVLERLPVDDGTAIGVIDSIDSDYPELAKSSKYVRLRADLGYKGLVGCFTQSSGYWSSRGTEECAQVATRFVTNDATDAALALRVAKLARTQMNSAAAVPFFTRALGTKPTAAVCKDEDLSLAVTAGLGLPPDYENAGEARTLAARCWDALGGAIIKAFEKDPKGGYYHQNACELLRAKKALSSLQEKQCKKSR